MEDYLMNLKTDKNNAFVRFDVVDEESIFVMLIGAPMSRKTQLANSFVESLNFVKVSPDDIRKELGNDQCDQSLNKEIFAQVYNNLVEELKAGHNVVYDATNCKHYYRKKVLNIVKDYAHTIIACVSVDNLSTCLDRNNEIGKPVPDKMIEEMYVSLKERPPHIFEGYDHILTF